MRLIKGTSRLQPISYASIWFENVHGIGHSHGRNRVKSVGSNTNRHIRVGLEQPGLRVDGTRGVSERLQLVDKRERLAGRLQQRQMTTEVHIHKNSVAASTRIHISKPEVKEVKGIQFYDIQPNFEWRGTHRLATIIIFDIETTGLSKEKDSIIEIALRDLIGGENSIFQTLINPGRYVPNTHIHGISTHMVNHPGVPRFKDLIPILLLYVQSRRIPSRPILWVAHNSRCFDVPFLKKEFGRCSVEIPADWLFLDTLSLARELAKLEGTKNLVGKTMRDLREYYGIPLMGEAHRALSDVNSLSKILQAMTNDMKLPVSSLLERSFKASDIGNIKKKKTTS